MRLDEKIPTMTNKRISSVTQLLEDLGADTKLIEDVDQKIKGSQLIKHMIAHRVRNGLSQKDIAERMKCTQSRISKLEAGKDDELRFGEFSDFLEALDLDFRVVITPKSLKAVDEVKFHAMCIRRLLHQLVKLAKTNDQVVSDGIAKFTGIEVPINLLKIVVDAIKHLPQDALMRLPNSFIHDVTQVEEDSMKDCETEPELLSP